MEFRQNDRTYFLPADLPFSMEDVLHWAQAENPVERMHKGDPSLWTDDPVGQQEVRNRLGWLYLPTEMGSHLTELQAFRDQCLKDGFTHVFVLGMGGSSLAPEVLSLVLGDTVPLGRGLKLKIIDTTNPDEILASVKGLDLTRILFVVSSKSGTTSETTSALNYFWQQVAALVGEGASSHFVAITDPGTVLEADAKKRSFRAVFHGEPTVGGRFSVFSMFGLLPAALLGLDLSKIHQFAVQASDHSLPSVPFEQNSAALMGGFIGLAAVHGRNKLTILADKAIAPLGAWLEQLIAESSGKEGKGILPVVDEPRLEANAYAADRLFAYLRLSGEHDPFIADLKVAGQPLIVIDLAEKYDLISEFYRWEVATALACAVLKVNAFDQPDVQSNKTRTRNIIDEFQQTGMLKESAPTWTDDNCAIYGDLDLHGTQPASLSEVLDSYLDGVKPPSFVAINAFVARSEQNEQVLVRFRDAILQRTSCATTLGFGPRFLHSTGQYHKGGTNQGIFIQITSEVGQDLLIPGENMHFGTLQRAQALGDFEVLKERGRRIIRLHLKHLDLSSLAL